MPRRRRRRSAPWAHWKATTRRRAVLIGALLAVAAYALLFYAYIAAPYVLKWRAMYGAVSIPGGYSIRGIDISHHQGRIDWDQLAQAEIGREPISFVFIKATEGTNHTDENFATNFRQAREHGLLRGAYHYFRPDSSARAQAKYFLRQVSLEPGDLPPVLDIEETGKLTNAELQNAAITWLRIVEDATGVSPIIYTNYKFKKNYLASRDFDAYPYWIAHYYQQRLSWNGPWKFWQHTDRGRLPGINGHVDLNVYNGSMYDLRKLAIPARADSPSTP